VRRRQLRRWHRERLVRRWLSRLRHDYAKWAYRGLTEAQLLAIATERVTTAKPCICWLCSSRRHAEGPTRQECLAELAQQEQIGES
jgi:hypothetical protein